MKDHTGKHQLDRRQMMWRGNVGKSLHCGFCGNELMRQGNQAWVGLVCIISVGSGL